MNVDPDTWTRLLQWVPPKTNDTIHQLGQIRAFCAKGGDGGPATAAVASEV